MSAIGTYESEISRLQGELDELDRLEQEELPTKGAELAALEILENRLNEIKDLERAQQQAEAERKQLESILPIASQLEKPKGTLETLPGEEQNARDAAHQAERRLKTAQTVEALQRWITAYRAAEALIDADKQIENAQEQAETVRGQQETLERQLGSSKTLPIAIVLLVIGAVAVGGGFKVMFLWPVAAVLIVAGVVVGVRGLRQRQHVKTELANYENQLREYEGGVGEQERRKEIVTEQNPPSLEVCVAQLEKLETDVPQSEEEAHTTIAALQDELGEYELDVLIRAVGDAQSELSGLAERRKSLEAEIGRIEGELDKKLAEVNLADIDAVKSRIGILQGTEATNESTIKDNWGAIADDLVRFDLSQETESALKRVAGQVGARAGEIKNLKERIQGRDGLKQQQGGWRERIIAEQNKIQEQYKKLTELSEKVGPPVAVPNDGAVPKVLAAVRRALGKLNGDQLKLEYQSAQQAVADAQAATKQANGVMSSAEARISQNLAQLELPPPHKLTRKAISALEPEFVKLSTVDQPELEGQREDLIGEIKSCKKEIESLESKLHLSHENLDEDGCRCEVETLGQRKLVCQKAKPIISGVRERMLSQVLPGTLAYMQSLLPLLTAGRYHLPDLDPNSYKIRVWDARAGAQGEYIEKDFFSGGTQDQFSLALRLGFALAALPQELGTSPGFIFLDEPLSAFDRQRTLALVKLLTEGEIAQRFDQIFLIAHDRTFETTPFPYRLRLEDGHIVEQNLGKLPCHS